MAITTMVARLGDEVETVRRPFSATPSTTLVQDVIGSSDLLVDSTAGNQLAVYRNPFAADATEAAVVVNGGLERLARGAEGRWELVKVVHEYLVGVLEAVAIVEPDGKVWIMVATSGGLVSVLLTQDGLEVKDGFSLPIEHLAVGYGGAAPVRGALAAGFQPNGTLLAYNYFADDPHFEQHIYALPRTFDGSVAKLALLTPGPLRAAGSFDGAFGWYDVTVPGGLAGPTVLTGEPKVAKVLGSYQEGAGAVAFLYLGTDERVYVARSLSSSSPIVDAIDEVTARDGHMAIGENGLITLYLVDAEGRLGLLRQVGWTPINFSTAFVPVWSTARDEQHRKRVPVTLGIAIGVDGVAVDSHPDDRPTVLALSAASESTHSVSLLSQDPTTGSWRNEPVRLGTTQAYQVSRFITRVALRDADGQPLRGHYVTLHGESALEAEIGGQLYRLGTRHEPITVQADFGGGLCIATAARGLTATAITLVAEGLPDALTIRPDARIQRYLAGTGTLPFFTPFNGETLYNAKVNGRPLIPSWGSLSPDEAVQHIHSTIALGDLNMPRPPAAALLLQTWDPDRPPFRVLASREELQAELERLRADPRYGGFWDDAVDFAHDVWEGIKTGAAKVACSIANLADNAVHFFIQVGGRLLELAQIAIHTLEEAFDAVAGVFNQLATTAQMVIDWMRAAIDFSAVLDTKRALRTFVDQLAPAIVPWIDAITGDTIETFFTGASQQVRDAFAAASAKVGTHPVSSLNTSDGEPPILVQAGEKVVDLLEFVQATVDAVVNWLWDKFIGQWLDKLVELLPSLSFPTLDAVNQAVNAVIAAFATVGADAARVIETLVNWFIAVVEGRDVDAASAVRDTALADLFAALERTALDGIEVLHTLALQLVAVVKAVINAVPQLLDSPLDLGAFRVVYEWIQTLAGVPESELSAPTLGDLILLLAAFPATYIYKLITRSPTAQPFPGGALPSLTVGDPQDDKAGGLACLLTSMGVGFVSSLFGGIADSAAAQESILTGKERLLGLAEKARNLAGFLAAFTGLISTGFFWPSKYHIVFRPPELETTGQRVAFANWLLTMLNAGLDLGLGLYTRFATKKAALWVKRSDKPIGVTLDTILGLTSIALGIVEAVDEDEDLGQWLHNIFVPFPAALQVLRFSSDPRLLLIKFVGNVLGFEGVALRISFSPTKEPALGPLLSPA